MARAKRLESLLADDDRHNIDKLARDNRALLWMHRQPDVIRVRSGLVLHNGRSESPIRQIEASKSAAVQLLLICIFEQQCRRQDQVGQRTTIPLRDPIEEGSTAWRYLLALPTKDRETSSTVTRGPVDNRVNQIKAALDRLADCGRVELRPRGTRNRYEHFRLMNEAVDTDSGPPVAYRAPRQNEHTIDVPAAFFLSGWVHALTDSEIITYLYMLHSAQKNPEQNVGNGMELTASDWAHAFGKKRDRIGRGYEAYRHLFRYGLIFIEIDPRRRADGTVDGFNEREGPYIGTTPHRFKVDLARLERSAVLVVAKANRDLPRASTMTMPIGLTAATRLSSHLASRDGARSRPPCQIILI